jgi:hypothetical protein
VWDSIVDAPLPPSLLSSLSSVSLGPSISTVSVGPPSPFQLCSWPRFVSFFLPRAAARAVHARVVGARADAVARFYFSRIASMGEGVLWPTLVIYSDFLVHTDAAARRLMWQLEPCLEERL